MKLTYRGVSYDYTPNPTPATQLNVSQGTYRGVPTQFYTWMSVPEQPSVDLTWRGVPYRTGTPVSVAQPEVPVTVVPLVDMQLVDVRHVDVPSVDSEVEADVPAPARGSAIADVESPQFPVPDTVSQVADMARNLFIRHHQHIRKREQGMMVRLAAEVGLPLEEVAHYESHIQGKVPHDFSGYDRSMTAMS